MKLQRVIGAQTNIQPPLKKVRQRIPLIRQKQRVVAQRAHRYPNLRQVEQILQRGHFAEENTVRDGVRGQKRRGEMVRVPGFAAVRPEDEGVCGWECQPRLVQKGEEDSLNPRNLRQLFKLAIFAYI
jgi:hypothetical protein